MGAPVTGLVFPITFPITFPAQAATGSGTVVNSGNADANVVFEFTGGQSRPGVLNATTGRAVRFPINLADGDLLVVDTADGSAKLNGEYARADASSDLLSDMRLVSGVNSVQSLGDYVSGTPALTVDFYSSSW
jgi:hypothetical protein